MFREKEKEEYKKITAPPELKDRIRLSIQECSKEKKAENVKEMHVIQDVKGKKRFGRVKQYQWVAAACVVCMVFLFGTFLIQPPSMDTAEQSNTVLYLDGSKIAKEPVLIETSTIATASVFGRSTSELVISIEIEVKEKTKITVSHGTIGILEKETNQVMQQGSSMELEQNQSLCWNMIPKQEESAELTVEQNGNQQIYVVSYDEKKQGFILYQK